jgi:hypothetical protein
VCVCVCVCVCACIIVYVYVCVCVFMCVGTSIRGVCAGEIASGVRSSREGAGIVFSGESTTLDWARGHGVSAPTVIRGVATAGVGGVGEVRSHRWGDAACAQGGVSIDGAYSRVSAAATVRRVGTFGSIAIIEVPKVTARC